MIRNVIIAENIGSYFVFSKKIVGIDISKTEIRATITQASGYKRKILELLEEKIENNNNLSYEERVINALKSLKTKLKKYDSIYASFSSSSVIFKELVIPFIDQKKIKMVVPFEVETLLPFTLDKAIIDCIITDENTQTNQTHVLVAAVKREHIENFLNLFEKAGITIDKITVDMFELYGLLKSIPAYKDIKQPISLIDIGLNTTRLALIINQQLKYIRVLPKGILDVAKNVAKKLSVDNTNAFQYLMRFGINPSDNKDYMEAFQSTLKELLENLRFSIEAFTKKENIEKVINTVIITGTASNLPGIKTFSNQVFEAKTEILEAKKILHNGLIESEITIPNNFIISLATSLYSPITEHFNLYQSKEQEIQSKTLNQQLIVLAGLVILLITSFSLYSYFRIRHLKNIAKQSEQEAIKDLEKLFKLRGQKVLESANKKANQLLRQQETLWQQLSIENRYSMLKYLSQLSKCIDPKKIQLDLTSIIIKDDTVKLYGSVPGYTQLSKLQDQLKCPLFKSVPKLQEYNFKAEPIVLKIEKDEEF